MSNGLLGTADKHGLIRISRCLLISTLCMLACNGTTPEEQAAMAARGYYAHLFAGQYEAFLDGKAGADTLPDGYREQLLTGYKQFLLQQQRAHPNGMTVVSSRAQMDTTQQVMQVFLLIGYADSIQEEIVVPMTEHDGRWMMK